MNIVTPDNIRIINEIGRWKAISLKNLSKSLEWKKSYPTLCRKLLQLEKQGLIKGTFEKSSMKYFTLTALGSNYSLHPNPYGESEKSIIHDLICTNAIQELLKEECFHLECAPQEIDFQIEPDGILYGQRKGISYVLAIEIELHQKSKKRLTHKFIKCFDEKNINYVLYITNKKTIFNTYIKNSQIHE